MNQIRKMTSLVAVYVIIKLQQRIILKLIFNINMKVSSMFAVSDKQYSDKKGLRRHIQAEHEGAEYTCNQCNYKATHYGKMKYHIQSVHEGVRYPCNLCNFQSTTFSSLKVHNQMKHEEVKYPCSHCDYKATHKSSLKRHNQSMHEGVKYVCNQCDYQVTYPEYMRRHIDSKHDDVEKFNKSDFYSICRIDFVQTQNISESNIECPECRMSFSIESQMEAHFLKVHYHVCR